MESSMVRIEDYKIISFTNHYKVTTEVRNLISEGYQPWGELSVVITASSVSSPIFSQAMVKYNPLWEDL